MVKRILALSFVAAFLAMTPTVFAGQLIAWGSNDTGQCDVPAGDDFITISHSLAIKSDGSLVAWRRNTSGQCNVPAGNDFVAVSGGGCHSLAVKLDGSIIAWGSNSFGLLDDVPEGNEFVDISGGFYYSAALKSDGSIVAWGENYFGQCNVPARNDFVGISAGGIHGVALKSDGSLATWGDNRYGQRRNVPKTNDFVGISGGGYHSLALKSDGSVVAWGMNNHAQCNVPADNDLIAISAGRYHSLGLKSDGSLIAWGLNADGQCNVPVGTNFSAISAGRYHNLAIIPEPSRLAAIELIGPEDVRKNHHAQYKTVAHYDDGTTRNATLSAIWWVEPNTIASIDSNGLLRTGDIAVSEDITIFARYTEGGVTSEMEKTVLISLSEILHVPADYQTIQEAIDVARYSDTVVIADGIYTGQGNRDIGLLGKAVTVRSENGPDNCIIDCQGTKDDQHGGFRFQKDEDTSSILDGFTIINGYAWQGGGIFCDNSNPMITNCIIASNTAAGQGGGICCRYSSPTITNCIITANSSGGDCGGGGINCDRESNPTITNCTISSNTARECGGAIYSRDSNPIIINCDITNNKAGWGGGGIYCGHDVSPTVSGCTIANCTISGNIANGEDRHGVPLGKGGGVRCGYRSKSTITNCVITGNFANYYGGGMSCWYDNSTTIANCTFAENSARDGNTLACDSRNQNYPSDIQLTNCILADADNGIWNNDNSTIIITYSNVQAGWFGEGNIDGDPCFVEAGYWDMNGVWVDGDYHLLSNSPCIDAGDPNYIPEPNETDLDGNPRIVNDRIDMGAYEYTPPILAELDINPKTLNLKSKGNFITCRIQLSEDYNVADIDPNSVFLEEEIPADRLVLEGQAAIVKFTRSALQQILTDLDPPAEAELLVSGELVEGTRFEGIDVVKVIDKGRKE